MTATRLMPLVLLAVSWSAWGKDMKFTDLETERFPYGEAVTITGNLSGTLSNNPIFVQVEALLVKSRVSGLPDTQFDGSIEGDVWRVTVGPFPENAVATLSFSFSGKITDQQAQTLIGKLQADADYQIAIAHLLQEAVPLPDEANEVYDVRRAAAFETVAESAAEALRKNLPSGLKLAEGDEDLVAAFLSDLRSPQLLAALSRLDVRANELRAELFSACGRENISPCPVKEEDTYPLGDLLELAADPRFASDKLVKRAKTVAKKRTLDPLVKLIAENFVAQLDVDLDLSRTVAVKDFEKFAGIDVAAIYLPSLDELRSFATLNIYFGPVEDTPAPTMGNGRGWAKFLQQRLSLTLGVSTGDISGRSDDDKFSNNKTQARISGNHAFLYGFGFRLNKHFRLTFGGSMFRNSSANTIDHALFVGSSVDLTGFKFLRSLVGKNK